MVNVAPMMPMPMPRVVLAQNVNKKAAPGKTSPVTECKLALDRCCADQLLFIFIRFFPRQRFAAGPFWGNRMRQNSDELVNLVLEEGPFSRDWVERWPESLKDSYFDLLGLDLLEMGLDEFRRQSRLLGETFLKSLDRPIDRCPYLFESWYRLTGRELFRQRPGFFLM